MLLNVVSWCLAPSGGKVKTTHVCAMNVGWHGVGLHEHFYFVVFNQLLNCINTLFVKETFKGLMKYMLGNQQPVFHSSFHSAHTTMIHRTQSSLKHRWFYFGMSKAFLEMLSGKLNNVKSRNMRTSSNDFSSTDSLISRFNWHSGTHCDMAHGKPTLQLMTSFLQLRGHTMASSA